MRGIMRKIVAVCICLSMIGGSCLPVFAEEYEDANLNQTNVEQENITKQVTENSDDLEFEDSEESDGSESESVKKIKTASLMTEESENDESNIIASGVEDNITWEISGDTLSISGTGQIKNYSYQSYKDENGNTKNISKAPWAAYDEQILKITINEGITGIGQMCFYGMHHFTTVSLPDSLKTMGGWAFASAESLKEVVLPSGMTWLGSLTFYMCTSLEKVVLPYDVTTLTSGVFQGCSKLKKIVIPSSVTEIYDYTFADSGLEEIYFRGGTPQVSTSSFRKVTATAYYPDWADYSAEHFRWRMNYENANISFSPYSDFEAARVFLSKTHYAYNGKARTPSATIQLGGKTLKEGVDYNISYRNNIQKGTAQAILTGMGEYEGTIIKDFSIHSTNEDSYPPELYDISVSASNVLRPGYVNVTLDIGDESSAFKRIYLTIGLIEGIDGGGGKEEYWVSKDVELYGRSKVTITVPVDSKAYLGTWGVRRVELFDSKENCSWFVGGDGKKGYINTSDSYYYPAREFEIEDEFYVALDTGLSNPYLISELSELDEGDTALLEIDSSSKGILPSEVFDTIRGKDITVVAYGDAYRWIVNGLNVTEESKDVDLRMSISKKSESEFDTAEDAVQVVFANNGVLPGKMQVRIKSDYLYQLNGKKGILYLYYLQGNNASLQNDADFDLVFDGADKWCYFNVTHNSTFIITGSKVRSKPHTPKGTIISSISRLKKGFTVKWRPQTSNAGLSKITGYQILYAKNKKFTSGKKLVTVKGYGSSKKKISKLKRKKYYYVKIRTYKVSNGRVYYSGWSSAKKVRTK